MNESIEIYSNLILATIAFVGPLIIGLLSTFTAGENRRKILAKKAEQELSEKLAKDIVTNPEKIRESVVKTSKEFKKMDKINMSELKRLNPIIQFWLIYGSLGVALSFLVLSYLVRANTWDMYNHKLSILILIFSVAFYLLSLFFIIRGFYTIIWTKRIIDNNIK